MSRVAAALLVGCFAALPAAAVACAFVCHEDATQALHHAPAPASHDDHASHHGSHAALPSSSSDSSQQLAAGPASEDCGPRTAPEPALAGFVREDLPTAMPDGPAPPHAAVTFVEGHADWAANRAAPPASSAPPASAGLPLRI